MFVMFKFGTNKITDRNKGDFNVKSNFQAVNEPTYVNTLKK